MPREGLLLREIVAVIGLYYRVYIQFVLQGMVALRAWRLGKKILGVIWLKIYKFCLSYVRPYTKFNKLGQIRKRLLFSPLTRLAGVII